MRRHLHVTNNVICNAEPERLEDLIMRRRRYARSEKRRGAVAVEFAVVAPVFVAIALGVIEVGRAYEAQNLLASAAREGGRFGSMDRTGMALEGQSSNDKLIADVKSFLAAAGVPPEQVNVEITHAGSEAVFDLDDPANELALFEVQVEVAYSAISYSSVLRPADGHPGVSEVGPKIIQRPQTPRRPVIHHVGENHARGCFDVAPFEFRDGTHRHSFDSLCSACQPRPAIQTLPNSTSQTPPK